MKAAIFDARSIFDRAFYAAGAQGLADGLDRKRASDANCAAVLNSLAPMLGPGSRLPLSPDHVLFCWDGQSKTNKNRKPKPLEFTTDLARFRKALPLLIGGAHAELPTEADDMVATAAHKLARAGVECVVVSSDKDMHQLVSPLIRLYSPFSKCEITIADVRRRWEVPDPSWVSLALALEGDKKDGISGVLGVGAKKRARLLSKVQAGTPITEAADIIGSALSDLDAQDFYASLEHTALNRRLVGLPDPAPLAIAPVETLRQLGLGGASIAWATLLGRLHMGRTCVSELDAEG